MNWGDEDFRVEIISKGKLWKSPGKNWCVYCGVLLHSFRKYGDKKRTRNPTRDHVTPKSKGGRKVVPCCEACNKYKADLDPVIFVESEWLKDRIADVRRRYSYVHPWTVRTWRAWVSSR